MKQIDLGGASCTLWLQDTPQVPPYKTATIGKFSCPDQQSGKNILTAAIEHLRQEGFEYLIGPMDQNTWKSYRFVTESDGTPPFFLEPQNPDFYSKVFLESDFEVIGTYSSGIDTDIQPACLEKFEQRLQAQGFQINEFDLKRADAELADIHMLSVEAFSKNYLYTPIGLKAFRDMYQPILSMLQPRYVLLARDRERKLKGFIFALPNFAHGPAPNQLIIKTYASIYPGLGRYLAEEIMKRAKEDRYEAIIHALMYDSNASKHTSNKYGHTFRRYCLYGRRLA